MSFPITVTLTLEAPPDEGLPPEELTFTSTMTVESKNIQRFKFTGSGTKSLDFGTIGAAGAKFLFVGVDTGVGAAPILCQVNGGDLVGAEEISPGGWKQLTSPSPVDGVTSLLITYTASVTVRVWSFS